MSIYKHNNKLLKHNNKLLVGGEPGPGPSLPPFTLRLKFKDGVTPTFSKGTGTLVDAENNIWDLTYENSDWTNLLAGQTQLLEVLDGNTTSVTYMNSMFSYCNNLTTVTLFDTSKVTHMNGMFNSCTSLTTVPLFDTSNVTSMNYMFNSCFNVQSGALALYKQASLQDIPPTDHYQTFHNCGGQTDTGASELAQIPDDWK